MKKNQVAYDNMMKRLHHCMSSDEMYLIAMAFVTLQTRFTENPSIAIEHFGTYGEHVYSELLADK